ncbi:MAG: cytochrome c biogenesis factor-like protein [Pseudomonadota bacterium]
MTGWLVLGVIAIAAALLLALIGFPTRLWTIAGTALLLGATGYAWQGSPGLAGHPVTAEGTKVEIPVQITDLRDAMFGRFGFDQANFMRADAMTRIGAPGTAVRVMQDAVRKAPRDAAAWTGLGTTLAEHDKGVSPAARMAFDRAMALWPQHPGPPFFLGLALARAGQAAEGRAFVARAVDLAPAGASYRPDLVMWLGLIDANIAAQARQGR